MISDNQSPDHMGYKRVIGAMMMMRRCHGLRGFRVNTRRFSVQRLRSKFFFLLKIVNRWRSSYGNALRSMKRNMAPASSSSRTRRRDSSSSSKRSLVMAAADHHHDHYMPTSSYTYSTSQHHDHYCRLRYYGRSNSFYSEAIADCLDFIKRNSLSVDEKPAVLGQR